MTDYFYDMDLVVDPLNTANVVANGMISIYDPADTAGTTLLALKDPTGIPLPNPLMSNANGFLPPRVAQVPQTMWKSGGFVGYFNSYKGLRDEAVAAKTAAQVAADVAGVEAAAVATAAIGTATAASTAAASSAATAASNASASAAAASTSANHVVTTATVDGTGNLVLTKANGSILEAGNVKGPQGVQGVPGVNGGNVLPTQEAIEQAIINAGPAKTAVENTVASKAAAGITTLKATGKADVGSVVLKGGVPGAMTIQDTLGTNGRRISMQPENPLTSTHSAQLEIVPGSMVSPAEVTAQILIYNKPGANYERFVISAFNGEYQFHSSNLGTGTIKPTFFYAGDVKSTAWMEDATFRVYTRIQFWDTPGNVEWASLKAVAANVLSTASSFRAAEGTSAQVRIGNTAGNGRPTITFGTDSTVILSRNASTMELAGAGLRTALDLEVGNVGSGVIMKSPNGTRFRLTVGNDGSLTTTAI